MYITPSSFLILNYISFMKLDQMVKYIVFPSDVTKDDTEYILYLLYPKYVDYDIQKIHAQDI